MDKTVISFIFSPIQGLFRHHGFRDIILVLNNERGVKISLFITSKFVANFAVGLIEKF